jgi:hypothetical protein
MENATAMSPYNDTWKIHRKNITKVASTNVSVSVFDRVQEAESALSAQCSGFPE